VDPVTLTVFLLLAILAIPLIRYFVWRDRYLALQDRLKRLEEHFSWLKETLLQVAQQVEDLQANKRRKRKPAKAPAIEPVKVQAVEQPKPVVRSEPLVPAFPRTGTEAPAYEEAEPKPAAELETAPSKVSKVPAMPEPPTAVEAAVRKEIPAKRAPSMLRTEAERIGKGLGRLIKGDRDQAADWETIVGRQWLNLVGIVVLVVGMVLLTQQTLLYLGPEGKIGTGALTGLVLLAGGVGLGRHTDYRLLAWTLLGGGWALLYFTAYAAHNIEQAKIIDSPAVAMVCLFVVASGIISHSFTYKSQLLTALAYGLGFLSVTMSPVTIYSLVASLVLAASLVAVLRVLPWHHLVLVGVVGTYINQWRWTAEVAVPWTSVEISSAAASQDFWLSTAIVVMYWVLFVVTSFVRRPVSQKERDIHFITNLLNTVGMLGLIAWQTWQYHHGQLYYLTAPASIAYVCVAYLDRRFEQRLLFLFNATIAVVLFAVSLPLALMDVELPKDWLALYWAAGALVVLYAGAKLKEIIIRVQAYLLFALASLAAWQFNLGGEFAERSPMFWPIVPVVVVVLTGVDDWLQRVKGQKGINPAAAELSWAFAIVATALLALLMWRLVEPGEAGLTWLLVGLALLEAGLATKRHLMRAQGYMLVACGTFAILGINLARVDINTAGFSLSELVLPNWQLCSVAAAALYYWAWRMFRCSGRLMKVENDLNFVPSWAATAILTLLIFRELEWPILAAGWMLLGLVLFAIGWLRETFHLRAQAYVLSAGSFVAAVAINIYELQPNPNGDNLADWAMAGFVAAGLAGIYFTARKNIRSTTDWSPEYNVVVTTSYGATLLSSLILWKELPTDVLAGSWMGLALILFAIGWIITAFHQRVQAYALSLASFAVAVLVNIYGLLPLPTQSHGMPGWAVAGCVTVGLAAIYASTRRLPDVTIGWFVERDVTVNASYGATLLLSLILWKELPSVAVAVAWTVLSLTLFEISCKFGLSSLRYQSHLLMIAVFGRVFMANFTIVDEAFGLSHRILSVTPIIATLYYLRLRILEELPGTSNTKNTGTGATGYGIYVSRLYSYAAAILVVALMRFELGRAYAVLGWAAILPIFYWLGRRQDEFDFRAQSYLLAILTFARSWATSVYLLGSFYGLPERVVTMVPVIAALLAATFMSPRQAVPAFRPGNWATYVDTVSRQFFAQLASTLVPILIFYQLSADYVSMGWAIAALALLGTGFATRERTFRLCGLALFLLTLGKVTLFDLAGVETIYRILSFIVLGVILLLASLAYTRYRKTVERYV